MENIREGFLKFKYLLVLFIIGMQYAAAWSDYICFVYNQNVSTLLLLQGYFVYNNGALEYIKVDPTPRMALIR